MECDDEMHTCAHRDINTFIRVIWQCKKNIYILLLLYYARPSISLLQKYKERGGYTVRIPVNVTLYAPYELTSCGINKRIWFKIRMWRKVLKIICSILKLMHAYIHTRAHAHKLDGVLQYFFSGMRIYSEGIWISFFLTQLVVCTRYYSCCVDINLFVQWHCRDLPPFWGQKSSPQNVNLSF